MNYKQNHRQELSDDSSGLLFLLDTEFEGNSEESDTSMGPHRQSTLPCVASYKLRCNKFIPFNIHAVVH